MGGGCNLPTLLTNSEKYVLLAFNEAGRESATKRQDDRNISNSYSLNLKSDHAPAGHAARSGSMRTPTAETLVSAVCGAEFRGGRSGYAGTCSRVARIIAERLRVKKGEAT